MALGTREDKITKPDGTTISRAGIVDSSILYYKTAYQENLTDICDFSDGSEIRTLHESLAVEVFSFYRELVEEARMKFVRYATGVYLDELACEYHLTRKKAEVARGTVTFTTSATLTTDILIPKGTVILARHTGYEYILESDVAITGTNTPANGIVYSKMVGAKYNAPIDKLTAFKDIGTIRTDVRVYNPTEIVDGVDAETDEELRKRILEAKRTKAHGTVPAYNTILRDEVPDIHDVAFVPPETLTTNAKYARHYVEGTKKEQITGKTFAQIKEDGLLCTKCDAVIFVNAESKPCPAHVLEDVEYVMTQQNNLVVGQTFHIEKAQTIKVYLYVELFVTSAIDEDILFEHLSAYFNGGTVEAKTGSKDYRGLYIGETLYKAQLINAIEDIPGVYQVGSIKRAKYDTSIPTDIQKWSNNGGAGFSYEDDYGYIFYRTNSEANSINYWGTTNFVSLKTHAGSVFQLAQQKEVDSTVQTVIGLEQILVDGNSIYGEDND